LTANDDGEALRAQRKIIVEFGRTALKSDSLDEILTEACRCCAEALDTEFAKVMALEEEGRTLRVVAGVGWKDGVVGEEVVPALPYSSEGFALFDGRPAISGDLPEDDFDYPKFLERHGIRSILNVIIPGADGRPPFGLLQVDSRRKQKFDEGDIEFLQNYANIVGAAIERFDKSAALSAALNDKERALSELQHRVGNNLAVLQSLIRARNAKADHPAVKQETAMILGQIEALAQLHEFLSTASDIDRIDLGGFLSALCSQIASFGSDGSRVCDVRAETESVIVETRTAVPMGIIANEFITNSLKYATRDGRCGIRLSVARRQDAIEVILADGGDGLGDALDRRGDPQTGSGLNYIEALIRQIRAEREWSDEDGTRLRILIPLSEVLTAHPHDPVG
jgi:two-component sensor histidine kinase